MLNAFIPVTADRALNDAERAEADLRRGRWKGPLHGIPIAVKDMFDTAGIRTTAAFGAFKGRVPSKDAEVVTKLEEVGAILLGKTNMHELAMGTTSTVSHLGAVHNPWNRAYVAGGSSGGSAVAVAAGLCYATVDTDAIGSCRLPAACCGVTGFKATYGLLTTIGILADQPVDELILRLGHTALTCRTAEDAAMLLSALASPEVRPGQFETDYRSALGTRNASKIGVARNFKATDEVRAAFFKAVETLRSLGLTPTEIEAPLVMSNDIKAMDADRKTITRTLFREMDVLILPTTTEVTPSIDEANTRGPLAVSPDNTYFCNYYGLPAISIPCGLSQNGLPLGLQIVGPHWGENRVLALAHRFQQTTQWHSRHPMLA